jgi:flagellar biosynthesis protein FlhG
MLTQDTDQGTKLRRVAASRSWTLAVTSGKGGVGKTSIAVNLALTWAQTGERTCLLDGDLGLANVDVLLNLHPRHSLRDVVDGSKALHEVVMEGPAGLQVIPAASGIEALADLTGPALRTLIQSFEALGGLGEMTVMDTGAGISRSVMNLGLAADEVLLITTPEPTALTAAYSMIKVLTQGRPGLPILLVLNMVDHVAQVPEIHRHLNQATSRFLQHEIPLVGWIPRDNCVERAVCEQRPLSIYFPYARATNAIQRLAHCLAARRLATGAPGEFWTRLAASTEVP